MSTRNYNNITIVTNNNSTAFDDGYFVEDNNKSPYYYNTTDEDVFTSSPTNIDTTNKEFLLFPTYAKRNPSDTSQWIVKAKGWALSHNSSTAKQKMMMGITKSVAGKSSADRNSSQMFEERFKYFLATNKRHKRFLIQAIGITTLEESRKRILTSTTIEDINQPLFNMLSTRFHQLISCKKQDNAGYFPITPPTDDDYCNDDEDNKWDYHDPILNSRPSNPISTVLDGNYFESNNNSKTYNRKRSSLSIIESISTNTTTTSTATTLIEEDPSLLIEGGVHLKTKGSGFLSGQFLIPHDSILNWAQEQNQCDARLIKIQSICTTENNKFLPNENIVNLIEPFGISIISDIDDTIKDTQIRQGARTVLSKTFFESPQSVTGMADAYMAWYSQGASFHYVSNSPFQLMPMLDKFIHDSQFPPGSLHLRDDGKLISRLVETPGQAKRDAILDILRDFPQRHFILVGDSGEIDLEIYTRIATEFPNQILKIYIRDVTTPTITELKKKQSLKQQQNNSPTKLSSLFNYPKKRSQSASDFTSTIHTTDNKKKKEKVKFRSPLGVRRAVTTMFAEYAVEPHLTGHRTTTIQSNDDTKKNDEPLLDPHRHQKISTREACEQLYHRVKKAKSQTSPFDIDIVLFQDADILSSDIDIRDALWEMWDSEINSQNSSFDDNESTFSTSSS